MQTIDTGAIRLNAAQVGALINRSPDTVANYAREGRLPSVEGVGGQRRYLLADVLEFIESSAPEPKAIRL